VGPGARTLTAFGALVPGLVLAKGQAWRAATAPLQASSAVQLALHLWALRAATGGLERRHGPGAAAALYLLGALVGAAWAVAVEPGRLVTAAGMGVAGLLAAAAVEGTGRPAPSKDDDDGAREDVPRPAARAGGSGGVVSSSSNEQFSFQPPTMPKRKRSRPWKDAGRSPLLLLLLEAAASWMAAYASLVGTVTAGVAGAACALLLFVGSPLPGMYDPDAPGDLLFAEDLPPPPPPPQSHWRDDDDSADTSIGSGKQYFNTPLMRRSILADEDEEDMPLGAMKGSLRKRRNGAATASFARTPGSTGQNTISVESAQPFSAARVIARVIGTLLLLLLTLIPAALVATGAGASTATTRAAVLGCRPLRILYPQDDDGDRFECAGGCIPLSRERAARKDEGMRVGRCDAVGYRCWQQAGTMTLRKYEANVGIYVVPSADGSCGNDDDGGDGNNDDVNIGNDEVEGGQYSNVEDNSSNIDYAGGGEVEGAR
jgi:hypothetical protein